MIPLNDTAAACATVPSTTSSIAKIPRGFIWQPSIVCRIAADKTGIGLDSPATQLEAELISS
jgi:hypothetical protein